MDDKEDLTVTKVRVNQVDSPLYFFYVNKEVKTMHRYLRWDKMADRLNATLDMHMDFVKWLHTKPVRVRHCYEHRFGRNRSCLDFQQAGYIGRKRQIAKCFMKGWYA